MITETLERQPTLHEQLAREDRQERMAEAGVVAMTEALAGRGEFWDDCHQSIYDAVRDALRNAQFAENRWNIVYDAICKAAMTYANAVAKDTD